MKVINSKLAAIGLAAFVFASCSDSTSENGGGTSPDVVDATTIGLTQSDAAALLNGVVNYKNTTANARKFFSRAAGENVTFPTVSGKEDIFNEPNTAHEITSANDNITAGTYYLKGGKKDETKTYDFTGKTITDATVYVHGGTKLLYDANTLQGKTKIVVEQGGNLLFTGNGEMIKAGIEVYNNLGTVKTDATQDIIIAGTFKSIWRGTSSTGTELKSGLGQVSNKDSNEPTQNITFKSGADVAIDGSIRAINLTIEKGATVSATGHAFNATDINLNGSLKVGGFVEAADLNISGYLKADATENAIKADHALTMEDGAQIDANYVNVTCQEKNSNKKKTEIGNAVLTLKGNCKLNIANKGVINVDKLYTDNAGAGQITLPTANSVAVIKAEEFHNTGAEYVQALATPADNATLLLQFTKNWIGDKELGSASDLDIAASYLDYDKATSGKLVEWKDEAHKRYGYTLNVNPEELTVSPKLDLFSATGVDGGTLSATSIQAANNKLYVTYHTNGNGKDHWMGGMEVSHIEGGNKLVIDQKVKATDGVDVNHGMIADNRFYVAADTKKEGAIFGYVALNADGTMKTDGMTTYAWNKTDEKNGADANCVAKFKDNYFLATNQGYMILNNDMSQINRVKTTVDVKHLATTTDKLYSLEATGNADGTVKIFDNISLENPQSYSTLGNVGVVDGKNTIAVDGTNLYVCQGDGGLVRYDANGQGTKIFDAQKGKNGNIIGRVNGVAVDDNYIYVACGGYGLVVLDKSNNSVVAKRRAYSYYDANGDEHYNSANYVTLASDASGNYICVAYGKSRVQIFKLTNTKK